MRVGGICHSNYMSLYSNILKQALSITCRYKYLWFFGLFATLIGGGGYEVISKSLSGDTVQALFPNFNRLAETGIFSWKTFLNLGEIFKTNPESTLALLLVGIIILVLLIFLIWLMVVSQIAIVDNSSGIIRGKKEPLGIKKGINAGIKYFWPVLGLNLIIKIIICLTFFVMSSLFFLLGNGLNSPVASYLYVILFIILVPIAVIFSFIIKYAICFVAVKSNNFVNAIKESWKLFIKNWLISIEMAFLLFFINFLAGLAIILVVLVLTVLFLFLALILYELTSLMAFWLIVGIWFIIALLITALGGAILTTFQTISWTGLFVELVSRGGTSKIVRIVENWKK